jgi:hypothetical protein
MLLSTLDCRRVLLASPLGTAKLETGEGYGRPRATEMDRRRSSGALSARDGSGDAGISSGRGAIGIMPSASSEDTAEWFRQLRIGQLDLRIGPVLGRGTYGQVYLALDVRSGALVAVKQVRCSIVQICLCGLRCSWHAEFDSHR